MKGLVQEFGKLKEKLNKTILLCKKARDGRDSEKEKALVASGKVEALRRQKSKSVSTLDSVEAVLAGKDPDYNTFDKVEKEIAQQRELVTVHGKMRAALNDKAAELHGEIARIEEEIQVCRWEIIKKAGLKLLNKTDKQLVSNLLLAVGVWSGQPLIKSLADVPGGLSEDWGVVHDAAIKDLLQKSGADVAV